jgi:hypothetical protein
MHWYVMVQGSYDCVFVGPFTDYLDSTAWIEKHKAEAPHFDYWPYTDHDMRESMEEFGAVPVQDP